MTLYPWPCFFITRSFLPITLLGLPSPCLQIHQPLRFRNLCLHLHNQHLQLLLTFLTGVCVDIAGVLFAVGPLGRIAPLEEMVVDFGDTAGAGLALAAHVGFEIGRSRLFRCGWGSFLPRP